MAKINSNYLLLPNSYLFAEIARKVNAYMQANPKADIIKMGIGDVTMPLTPAITKAMEKAVKEMGEKDTFRGYGPEQGYDFLIDAVIKGEYKSRNIDISHDEVFISDGSKCDVANIQEIFDINSTIAIADPVYPVYLDSNVMAGRSGALNNNGYFEKIIYMPSTKENNFKPSFPSRHADLIYICSPNNPTGAALTKEELKAWVDYAIENNSIILYDSAYSAYIQEENVCGSIYEIPNARKCAIEFKSFSKTAGFTGIRCAFTVVPKDLQAFDDAGNYKLQAKLEEAYNKMPAQRTRFDKDLMKLDEQLNIFHQLINHQMLNLFPKADDPNHKWYASGDDLSVFSGKDSMFVSHIMDWYLAEVQAALKSGDWSKADEVVGMISTYQQAKNKTLDISEKRMQMELKYNRLDVFRTCKIGYLILGGLLLLFAFVRLFKQPVWMKGVTGLLSFGILAVFMYHIVGMGMRWYIGGYAPWSNSYETMVYVGWATVLAGLLFARRSTITFALATLFGGIILFVSGLNWMDPEINPLVPVLKSPWLMFHVAVIVAAYGFFGISCLIGLTNLVMMLFERKSEETLLRARITELTIVNEMSLWIGLALMTVGTFLGAVWANESWGRYWGWDPKETWALITMVLYAVTTHLHLVKRLNNAWIFNLASVLAFASVLMTFFGVNYFLSGMHSYGQNDNVSGIFVYLYAALGVIIVVAVLSYRSWKLGMRQDTNKHFINHIKENKS